MQRMKHKGFLYVCTTGVLGVSCCPNDNPSSIQTSLTCRLPSGQTARKASRRVLCCVLWLRSRHGSPFRGFPRLLQTWSRCCKRGGCWQWLLATSLCSSWQEQAGSVNRYRVKSKIVRASVSPTDGHHGGPPRRLSIHMAILANGWIKLPGQPHRTVAR